MDVHIDQAIARLAGRKDGVVTRAQLAALGLSPDEIQRLLRCGRLHRVHRGVYNVGHPSVSARGALRAALFAVGDDAVLSHRSAAAHWDLLRWNGHPELTTTRRTGAYPPRLTVHRVRRAAESTVHQGFRVTTVAQTILDVATVAPSKLLARALGEAEYQRIVDREHLRALAAGRAGAVAVRIALGDHSAPTASGLEDRFLDLVRKASLTHPELNAVVCDKQVDFLWRAERVIVETDGWAAHGRRSAFVTDRARDLDLEARGYRTGRNQRDADAQAPAGGAGAGGGDGARGVNAVPRDAHSAASSHQ